MLDTENQTLKDILIANDVCTEKQLAEVIEEHERTGTPLQELLVDFGLFTKEELLEQIAHSLGTEVYDLSDLEIPEEVRGKLEMHFVLDFEQALKIAFDRPGKTGKEHSSR